MSERRRDENNGVVFLCPGEVAMLVATNACLRGRARCVDVVDSQQRKASLS